MKFGTDGVRGVANSDLTASFALDLGRAAARVLGGAEAVVGGDTRVSTAMLEAAFVAGLASEGVVVHRLGVVPSPVVAFESARRGCLGAVISASHNPYQDNGIKLFAPGGTKLSDDGRGADRGGRRRAARRRPAIRRRCSTPRPARPTSSTCSARSRAGASTGCASSSTPPTARPARSPAPLLRTTGADVVAHPRPARRPQHQRRLRRDAHRVARRGRRRARRRPRPGPRRRRRPAARRRPHRRARRRRPHHRRLRHRPHARGLLRDGTVVVTVMTNLGFRLGMEAAGIEVVETAVGDRYVLEALAAGDLSLGGEQSGHVIFRDLATTGDGLLTGADPVRCRAAGRSPARRPRRGGDDAPAAGPRQRARRAPRCPTPPTAFAAEIAAAERRARRPRPGARAPERHRAARAGDGRGADAVAGRGRRRPHRRRRERRHVAADRPRPPTGR